MRHGIAVETTDNVYKGISLLYFGQKLARSAFGLSGAFGQTGNVNQINSSMKHTYRMDKCIERIQSAIRNIDLSDVRLLYTLLVMDFCVCNTIEQSGFACIGQTYDSTFQCHFPVGLGGQR